MTILKRKVNFILKSTILIIALLLLVSTSNRNDYKTSNSNLNLTLDLTSMAKKVHEDIENDLYSAKDTYTGYLTGYGADCPLCSGHLACMPSLDVLNGNIYYTDSVYGNLNIVASSSNLACGTVVRINSNFGEIMAIVLDRGVGGNNLDLLQVSEQEALINVGRSIVSYDILRKGW